MSISFLGGSSFPWPQRPQKSQQRGKSRKSESKANRGGNQKPRGSQPPTKGGPPAKGGAPPASGLDWINQQWSAATTSLGKAVTDLQANSKKFELPVKVDVDWVKPTLISLREMSLETWENLPPPVRMVVPYAAVSLLTGIIVQQFNSRTIRNERNKNEELQKLILSAAKENKSLEEKIRAMQDVSYSSPQMETQVKMAGAVAQATMAAAQAADAAAAAAQACGIRIRKAVVSQK